MSIESIVLLFVIALNSVLAYAANTTTKYLYVLVPDDKEWLYDDMMVSTDGGVTGTKMEVAPGMCGWYRMAWEEAPEEVLIYLQNHPDQIVGQYGLWGEPTPLPLNPVLEAFGTDRLYFIPDDSQWPDGEEDAQGLFLTDPGVSGVCSFDLAAVIYDTDESLWTSKIGHIFSTEGEDEDYAGQCLGVRTGIVQTGLGADGKPRLDTTSGGNGIKCFGSSENFNKLFNYVEGLNEVQCYNMPFRHYGTDSRWAFDSDSATMAGNLGGFHPVDNTSDATVETSISPVACSVCRTKRYAQGPVPFTMEADAFDKYCSGPGWDAGVDCGQNVTLANEKQGGLFGDSDHPADMWDWGATRWESTTGHNQQFCFESHAKFTYQEYQELSFRGSDDIWVFINKKLAIDNGGTHLPAPGYVQLKQLNNTYGKDFLVPGQDYQLDIFFCDRRTTMSDVTIKTNILIKQTTGLSSTTSKNSDGSESYSICYDQSGDGSCASVALGFSGGNGTVHACGSDIRTFGTLKYKITTRAGVDVAMLESGKSGWQYGGFDLSDPFNPKVNKNKISGLAPGNYRLVIEFCDKNGTCNSKARTYTSLRIKGNLDVMTQSSTYTVNKGDSASIYYKNGTKWTFVDKALAGTRVPVYVSAFADGGVDLLGAVGQTYSLTLSAGMKAYTTQTGSEQVTFPKCVGVSGIDTIWVSQGLDGMTANPEVKTVSLKSRAKIEFYAPRFDFAEPWTVDSDGRVTSWKHPIAGDPDLLDGNEYFHWVGSDVGLYVVVVNPLDNQICTNCQMLPTLADASAGVIIQGGVISLGEGAYAITVRSSKEYMDTTAYITISAPGDVNGLSLSSYANMRFRQPPVPYPQLVDLFDTRGKTLGRLSIPEPYYSETKDYLDGRADSIAIYYSRPFNPNSKGSYTDSLPHLICLDWDEENYENYNFFEEGVSNLPEDTLARCSYIFFKEDIVAAHKARVSDSILAFAVRDTAFSKRIKTAGKGKILSYAQFEIKRKIVKQHFDRNITDRMAPVIVSASVADLSEQLSRLTVTLSEPVKMLDETNKQAPFSFYMNSATEVSEAKRYASSLANAAPVGLGTNKLTIVFDKTQPTKNPTPRLGDYVRLRSDSWMWSDTADIAVDDIERNAQDYYWHWNSPTDYNSFPRLPSPWVRVKLDDSYSSSSQGKLSSSSKNDESGKCTLTDKGDGRIIQKCGDQKTVLYKALCGNEPYDPDGDYFCYGVKLYEKCDDEVYDVNSQECVDDEVVKKGSKSSGKNKSQAIKTVTQVSWLVQTSGRTIHIQGVKVGSAYALIDMQGRVLSRGVVNNKNFTIPVGLGGQYMLKIGNQSLVIRVW